MEGVSCDSQTSMTDTYGRPLFECFTDRKIQVIVHTPFDQGNNIDRFKNIVDKTWKSC